MCYSYSYSYSSSYWIFDGATINATSREWHRRRFACRVLYLCCIKYSRHLFSLQWAAGLHIVADMHVWAITALNQYTDCVVFINSIRVSEWCCEKVCGRRVCSAECVWWVVGDEWSNQACYCVSFETRTWIQGNIMDKKEEGIKICFLPLSCFAYYLIFKCIALFLSLFSSQYKQVWSVAFGTTFLKSLLMNSLQRWGQMKPQVTQKKQTNKTNTKENSTEQLHFLQPTTEFSLSVFLSIIF